MGLVLGTHRRVHDKRPYHLLISPLSRRQFIYQFEKWDWKKYTRDSIAVQSSGAKRMAACMDSDASFAFDEGVTSNTTGPRVQPPPNFKRTRQKPNVPLKNPKLSGLVHQKGDQPPRKVLSKAETANPWTLRPVQCITNVPQRPTLAELRAKKTNSDVRHLNEPIYRELLEHEQQLYNEGEATPHVGVDLGLDQIDPLLREPLQSASAVDKDSKAKRHAYSFCKRPVCATAFPDRPVDAVQNQFSSRGGHRRIDLNQPVDELRDDEIRDIKSAADFLFAAKACEDSCTLYILLLKYLRGLADRDRATETSVIFCCVRSAAVKTHIVIARQLLEDALEEGSEANEDTAEVFLYRSLLSDISRKEGKDDKAIRYKRLAMQSEFAKGSLDSPLPGTDRAADLAAYCQVKQVLSLRNRIKWHNPTVTNAKSPFPGPFEVSDGRIRCQCLRDCLRWCISQLRSDINATGTWGNLKSNSRMNDRHVEAIGLFSELWERAQRSCIQGRAPDWINNVEQELGLPPTEVVMVTSIMILGACPTIDKLMILSVWYQAICERAVAGGMALLDKSDLDIARTFLEAYEIHLEPLTDRSHLRLARDYARAFIQRSLQLELPNIAYEAGADDDQVLEFERPVQQSLVTVASSLSSAEMSSFRALRNRIKNGCQVSEESVVECLPSAFVGQLYSANGSNTWISGRESLKTCSQSAFDSMDDLSARLREVADNLTGFQSL